jgi:hypothetical protein
MLRFHKKSFVLIILAPNSSSIPLFSISPMFVKKNPNPVVSGMGKKTI